MLRNEFDFELDMCKVRGPKLLGFRKQSHYNATFLTGEKSKYIFVD